MQLNLNQLRIFFFCGRHSTFSDAANALCLSQPAVTVQIKQLETLCGIDLFHHHRKSIELTDAGRVLFDYAQKIFDLTESAENAIQALRNTKNLTLSIGALKIYARFILPSLKLYYQRKHPGMRVAVDEGNTQEIIKNLLNNKDELGLFSIVQPPPPQLKIIPYSQEEMFLFLSSDHPLNSKGRISVKDLTNIPLVVRERGSVSREVILTKYREVGIEPGPLIEVKNIASIIDEVQAGRGVSFIAEWSFMSERIQPGKKGVSFIAEWALKEQVSRDALQIRSLDDEHFLINVVIAYLKDTILSSAALEFIDLLLEKKSKDGSLPHLSSLKNPLKRAPDLH